MYSSQTLVSDGTVTRVDLSIEYLAKEDIQVFVDDALLPANGYAWTWASDTAINFNHTVSSGSVINIRRTTAYDNIKHIFEVGGAVFKDRNVDENFRQVLYWCQDFIEGKSIKDVWNNLNMHGHQIRNLGSAVDSFDAVSLGQYQADAMGAWVARREAELLKEAAFDKLNTTQGYSDAMKLVLESNDTALDVPLPDGSRIPTVAKRTVDLTGAVTSVNGQTGAVVIDTNKGYNLDYFASGKSYPIHSEIMLDSGVKVASTVPNNTNNPNVNMTGWEIVATSRKQLGITNVDNTSDLAKPVSTLTQAAIKAAVQDKANKTYVDDAVGALSTDASKQYATLALANADIANIALNKNVFVSERENGGYWYKATARATTLTKSNYDPITQAKSYTDHTIAEVIALKKSDDPNIFNIVNDGAGNSLVYIDKATGVFHAVGLYYTVFNQIFALKKYTNSSYAPIAVDANGNMLAWINKVTHKFEAVGLNSSGQSQQKNYKYFAQKPSSHEINHVLSYGQSLSVGATATTILSTTQPYSNLTFNSSPRQDTKATSVIPLVEQFNNPSIDGYANRGETHCSGMANYASRAMMLENGINPQDHIIFASTAGHGGYTIDQLKKGSAWYSILIDHVNKAKELNTGKSYHVPVVPWIQGENNAVSNGLQTPYAEYKAKLVQLQIDADTDIKAITAQTDPVRFITYQMSYAAATWPDVAKAQLDLVRANDNFMLATPMYHFPYAGDRVHLTNIGYKWMGAYFGRAYKQYMIEGRKPDFINPLSARITGNQITIKFDVPTLPLRIDTTTLASTTNAGFKVMRGSNEIAITGVTALDDTVILQLASTLTGNAQVRYALDYLGVGLTITGGASGNLRDSTTDSVIVAAVEKPLYHVCPHFELTAFLDKGI